MNNLRIFTTKRLNKHFLQLTLITIIFFTITSFVFAQIEDDDEIIDVDSSMVIMNATITDENGDVVFDLKEKQFEVYEDGVKQDIVLFKTEETPFAAIVLLDTSGSMKARVGMARAATIKFLNGIRSYDNVAIYNFDTKVSLIQDFSNLRDLIPQAFDLKSKGWTVLNDAIYQSALKLDKRKETRRAIIVLSDGADTKSRKSSKKALNAALKANATIYTVDMSGIKSSVNNRQQNRKVLKKFAKRTGGKFLSTPGGRAMREAFDSIVKDLGVQYTIGYHPKSTKKDGKWRKLELKLDNKNYLVRTREGYNAPSK